MSDSASQPQRKPRQGRAKDLAADGSPSVSPAPGSASPVPVRVQPRREKPQGRADQHSNGLPATDSNGATQKTDSAKPQRSRPDSGKPASARAPPPGLTSDAGTAASAAQVKQSSTQHAQALEIAERLKFMGLSGASAAAPAGVEEYVKQLQTVVPGLDQHRAVLALSAHEFDVDATASALLQGESATSGWVDAVSKRQKSEQSKQQRQEMARNTRPCHICGDTGHLQANCPKKHLLERRPAQTAPGKPKQQQQQQAAPTAAAAAAVATNADGTAVPMHQLQLTRKQKKQQQQPQKKGTATESAPASEGVAGQQDPTAHTHAHAHDHQHAPAQPEVDDSLICPVCNQLYNDPRMLDCLHSVCGRCLDRLITPDAQRFLICPVCNSPTEKPQTGLHSVLANHALAAAVDAERAARTSCQNCEQAGSSVFCYQCDAFLCDKCSGSVHSQRIARSHNIIPASAKKATSRTCSAHAGERLALYCLKCSEVVCSHCMLVGNHQHHNCVALKDICQHSSAQLQDAIVSTQQKQKGLVALFESIDSNIAAISASHEDAARIIDQRFAELHHLLEMRRQQLQQAALHVKETKTNALRFKQDELRVFIQQVKEGWLCASRLLELCDDVELMDMKKAIERRLKTVNKLDVNMPGGDNAVAVLFDHSLDTGVASYGVVSHAQASSPQEQYVPTPSPYAPPVGAGPVFGSQRH